MAKRSARPVATSPAGPVLRTRKVAASASAAPRPESAADAPAPSAATKAVARGRSPVRAPGTGPISPMSAPAVRATPPDAGPRPSDEEVRQRAYHRFLARGGTHGRDQDDWLAAEAELRGPTNR